MGESPILDLQKEYGTKRRMKRHLPDGTIPWRLFTRLSSR